MHAHLAPEEILGTLRELSAHVTPPLWLFGGVAADFIVGRWTRPHGDVDLNALAADRVQLTRELNALGYHSPDTAWLTHWHQPRTGRAIEVVFLERDALGEAVLVISPDAPVGKPGRYATVPGYLDADRWSELEGVRFRVSSPLGEYRSRTQSDGMIGGRTPEPKIEHDRRLLEAWLRDHPIDLSPGGNARHMNLP